MSLRETLQAFYACPDRHVAEGELGGWYGWAARSRLSPFRNLANIVRQHWDGILAYFDTQLTSASIDQRDLAFLSAKEAAMTADR